MNTDKEKIGIIGYGNMGSAIGERIKNTYKVYVFDKDREKTKNLKNITVVDNIIDLLEKVDTLILAIKPQDFESLLKEIKDKVNNKLIISIAAGISTKYIENILGMIRVIRVMPNIGALVGRAVSYICKGGFSNAENLKLSIKLFNFIGHTFIISEDLMHSATAVGGSGPGFWGYLFDKKPKEKWDEYKTDYFIPQLISAAKSVGFDEKMASLTADLVTAASISTVEALHITPAELTKKVASKGGTTEAGLEVLQKGGTLTDAVRAAIKRAEELSKT